MTLCCFEISSRRWGQERFHPSWINSPDLPFDKSSLSFPQGFYTIAKIRSKSIWRQQRKRGGKTVQYRRISQEKGGELERNGEEG